MANITIFRLLDIIRANSKNKHWHEKETQLIYYVGKNLTVCWLMAANPAFAQTTYHSVTMFWSLEITNDNIWRSLCRQIPVTLVTLTYHNILTYAWHAR